MSFKTLELSDVEVYETHVEPYVKTCGNMWKLMWKTHVETCGSPCGNSCGGPWEHYAKI